MTDRQPPRDSNFSLAFRLLPRSLRSDLRRLYGALRVLDDLVDELRPDAAERIAAVEAWCNGGAAASPETQVFAHLAHARGLGVEPVTEFCLAMRHDLGGTIIETDAQLDDYCRNVAGSVGVMVAQVLGALSDEATRKMTTLGTAVQRAHILRDIDLDRAAGRTFVPQASIERFGSLAPGRREALLRDQIARADALFDEAADVARFLPRGRWAISACAALYREILRQIERDGYGGKGNCPTLSSRRKGMILVQALHGNR